VKRTSTETESRSAVERLAELFPGAVLTRLPVEVVSLRTGGPRLRESTVIECGTSKEALFQSSLPLEFGDQVRLANSDNSFDARATVVAVHLECGNKAVAVRFAESVRNWIIR
jgi:hypothetical protein